MTFLNSIFLAALAAVTIPLLIHFLSRRRIKVIDFSSLRFLLQMQKSRLRWLRIRDIILLLLRIATLALLVLAFARPAITSRKGQSNAPVSTVLLIDNSPSCEAGSNAGTVFDDLKRTALEIIDMAKPGDETFLITLAGKPTLIGRFGNSAGARTALLSTTPQAGSPDVAGGVSLASKLLETSHNINRDIFLISDFQDGPHWKNLIDIGNDPRTHIFAIIPESRKNLNISVASVEFPPQLLAPGEEFQVKTLIRNHSETESADRLVELHIDNSKKAQTIVSLNPQESRTVEFITRLDRAGRHLGYLEIEDDDYPADNRAYFCIEIPAKIKVLAISENDDGGKIIKNCLAKTKVGFIEYSEIHPNTIGRQDLSAFNVIVVNDLPAPAPISGGLLKDFLGNGGGLFLILGDRSNPELWRNFLIEISGITVGSGIPGSRGDGKSYYEPAEFDYSHPILDVYSPQNEEAPAIPPLKFWTIRPLAGGRQLIALGDRRAVMAESEKGKILVLGTGLDLKSSDLAVHSFIVPLLIRSVEYLATSKTWREEYLTSGKTFTLMIGGARSSAAVTVSGPGVNETLELKRGLYGSFINLPSEKMPGFYSVIDGSDTLAVFAINHDSLESIGRRIEIERLGKLLGDVTVIEAGGKIAEKVAQAKFGIELWKYCLALALLSLIFESLLTIEFKTDKQNRGSAALGLGRLSDDRQS